MSQADLVKLPCDLEYEVKVTHLCIIKDHVVRYIVGETCRFLPLLIEAIFMSQADPTKLSCKVIYLKIRLRLW